MAVTAARTLEGTGTRGYKAGDKAGGWQVKEQLGQTDFFCPYSKGTTISFSRTMFRRLRAAASMARGSFFKRCTSFRKVWLLLLSISTSDRTREYCCEAKFNRAPVRIVTVTQTANVARITIPKITHAGIIPPRRRTSARVPMRSSETALACDSAAVCLGATRCDLIRSSTQYVFATLLKKHLQVLC